MITAPLTFGKLGGLSFSGFSYLIQQRKNHENDHVYDRSASGKGH